MSGEKSGGNDKGLHPNIIWPFFTGFVDGAIGRPGYLWIGGVRTASWIGLNGPDARNNIVFHNFLTYRAARYGFNYIRNADVDPGELQNIWSALPQEAQTKTIEWGAKTAGGMVGGAAMGTVITKQLSKVFPKRFVVPIIFFLGCQGFCASIWKDQWGGGPPPPPGGFGGGGGGIGGGGGSDGIVV